MIDSQQVNKTFQSCLFKEDELTGRDIPRNAVLVEGIVNKFGFHKERLESTRPLVTEWLKQLPHQFHKNSGGGWSFLNACNLETGEQWTGLHRDMEQLFCLGIGLGLVKCQLSRDIWSALPGGMPYYVIDITTNN